MVVGDAVGPAADEVVALAAVYPVLAVAALDLVHRALAAVEDVARPVVRPLRGAAPHQIVAGAAVDLVHAAAPLDPVVALLAKDVVAAVPALQGVLAAAAEGPVVPVFGVHRVGARAAHEPVVVGRAPAVVGAHLGDREGRTGDQQPATRNRTSEQTARPFSSRVSPLWQVREPA